MKGDRAVGRGQRSVSLTCPPGRESAADCRAGEGLSPQVCEGPGGECPWVYGEGPQAGVPSGEQSPSSPRSPISSCTESQLGEGPGHSYLSMRGLSRGCVCSSDAPASEPIHPDLRHTHCGPGYQHPAPRLRQQLPGGLLAPTRPPPPLRIFLHLATRRLLQSQRQAISSLLKTLPRLPVTKKRQGPPTTCPPPRCPSPPPAAPLHFARGAPSTQNVLRPRVCSSCGSLLSEASPATLVNITAASPGLSTPTPPRHFSPEHSRHLTQFTIWFVCIPAEWGGGRREQCRAHQPTQSTSMQALAHQSGSRSVVSDSL